MRALSQKAYMIAVATVQGDGLPTAHTGLHVAPFSSGFCKFPVRVLHSLVHPLGSQQMLTGLPTALKDYFPKCPLPSFYFSKPFPQYVFSKRVQCSYVVLVWCRSYKFEAFSRAWQLEHAGTGITEVFLRNKT